MEELNLPSDVFDSDDLDSPLDPINVDIASSYSQQRGSNSPAATGTSNKQTTAPTAPQALAAASGNIQTTKPEQRRQPASQPRPRQQRPAPTEGIRQQGEVKSGSKAAAIETPAQPPLDWNVDLSFFTDGRFSRMVGVSLILIAVYLLTVSISFFSTGAADQSALGVEGAEVENAGGIVGAIISHALIAEWLGLGAFVIIFLLTALGLAFVRLKPYNIIGLSIKSLVTAISLSIVAGYVSMHFTSSFSLGGLHGYYINSALMNLSGEIGALLLSVLLIAMVIIIFIKEVSMAVGASIKAYRGLRDKVARENRDRQARQESGVGSIVGRIQPDNHPATDHPAVNDADPATAETAAGSPAPVAEPHENPTMPTPEEIHRPIVVDNQKLNLRLSAEGHAYADSDMPPTTNPAVSVNLTSTPDLDDIDVDDRVDLPESNYAENSNRQPVGQPIAGIATEQKAAEPANVTDAVAVEEPAHETASATVTTPPAPPVTQPAQVAAKPTATLTDIDDIDTADNTGADDPDRISVPKPEAAPAKADIIKTAPEIVTAQTINTNAYDPTAELSHFHFPSLDTLNERPPKAHNIDIEEQEANKQRIRATLNSFGIEISHIEATIGPTVTLYEVVPGEGVRISKIKNLEDDIARSIAAIGTRIIAPIPGKETVGIEVPNKDPQIVPIRTVLSSEAFQNCKMALPMAMGATISNDVYIADLTKMPHLLVAGATGMGKSVGLNTIIASLLFKKHPAELKFVMVDPKMVEFSLYKKLERHYLAKLPDEEEPIITDPHKVVPTLNSLCVEMDNRYKLLQGAYVRSISEYNKKFTQRMLNPADGHRFLPYIVVVVDEFADLIMMAGKEVEQPIARIAQKARAVGIHLILATQRPSTNVITGIIKANFPGRIAFRVFQMVDSRTILDRPGANQLIGRGDMLFSRDGVIDRVQCALIETEEVERMCDAIASQQGYFGAYELPEYVPEGADGSGRGGSLNDADPLFGDAGRYVISANQASTTSLQRRYEIGYPRAGKIMDQLEKAGVVGPAQGSKPRSVLIDSLAFERLLENMGIN